MFVIAFDADKTLTDEAGKPLKRNVLQGEKKLIAALLPIDDVYSAEWDLSAAKGIDDLLTAGGTYRLVDRYVPPKPRPRVPRPCASPGPVDGPDDLREVRRETAERIARRFEPGYANTVALVAPPPGTSKTGSVLRSLEVSRRHAAIGVPRHVLADELVSRSGSEPCRCGQPRMECDEHRVVLHHDVGRGPDNCGRWDVVEAARAAGYEDRVGLAICGTREKPICPLFLTCGYQEQFARRGSHVAPVEVVTQRPTFTEHMSVVMLDDLDSSRLLTERRITEATLEHARKSPGAKSLLPLIDVLSVALRRATTEGAYHGLAYALLDDAARSKGTSFEAVLAGTPPAAKLTPAPTVEAYRSAMPGQLLDLVQHLHEEYAWVRTGAPFTSGLRITAVGIDIARLLAPTVRSDGRSSLTGKSVVVMSSTPDPILRQWIAGLGLEVLKDYRPQLPLPESVRVIQDVAGFYGKQTVQANDMQPLLERAGQYLRELKPARPAVVTHKQLSEHVANALDLPIDRILYFGNVRGSNSLRDADALLIIGTPGMSTTEAYWMSCAAYRGEGSPPSHRMALQYQPYGGWRDGRGRGREIEVLTFVDKRVAEIYESSRRDELVQAIYRCRPFDLASGGAERTALTVVLLSAMPVQGLRVDELRFAGNAERAEAATARLHAALDRLNERAMEPTSRVLARAAGTDIERAQSFLRSVSAVRSPTYTDPLIQVGDQAAETSESPDQSTHALFSGCSCAPCPANRGDKCNCGKFWFTPSTGLNRVPHCGVHDPKPEPLQQRVAR